MKTKRKQIILPFITYMLIAVMFLAVLIGLYARKETAGPDNSGAIIGEDINNGVSLQSVKIEKNDYAKYKVSEEAETAYTITAAPDPATADNTAMDWSVEFVNPSSDWATGKTVTEYVTITPTSDGALTAVAECLKPFGEQIYIVATARAFPDAQGKCPVDYARRITDFAFWSTRTQERYFEFGESEILLDMTVPSYSELTKKTWTEKLSVLPPLSGGDPETDGYEIFDEDIAKSFQFSDYTIKDNKLVAAAEDEYLAEITIEREFNTTFYNYLTYFLEECNSGMPVTLSDENYISDNPLALGLKLFTPSRITKELYDKHMTRMVTLLKENAETPIMTFHITITGKYSTFKKDITVRYNPETVIMPVNNVTVNPDGIVF